MIAFISSVNNMYTYCYFFIRTQSQCEVRNDVVKNASLAHVDISDIREAPRQVMYKKKPST